MIYLQVFFATAVWGAAYPFTKWLVTEISPLSIVTLRCIIGSLFLILFTKSDLTVKDFRFSNSWKILIMSILGISLQQWVQAYSLKYTEASHAGWIIATTPIIVAGLMVFLGEKMGLSKITAILLGFTGALLVVVSKGPVENIFLLSSTKGDFVFVTSCVLWAFYVILTDRWITFWKQAKTTTVTMLIALVSILPLWVARGGHLEILNLSVKGFMCLLYLGILSSALAYMFWNNSVETIGPTRTAYFIYVEPFATLVSAYIFLSEPISPVAFLGGILILAGVYIINPIKKFKFLNFMYSGNINKI